MRHLYTAEIIAECQEFNSSAKESKQDDVCLTLKKKIRTMIMMMVRPYYLFLTVTTCPSLRFSFGYWAGSTGSISLIALIVASEVASLL